MAVDVAVLAGFFLGWLQRVASVTSRGMHPRAQSLPSCQPARRLGGMLGTAAGTVGVVFGVAQRPDDAQRTRLQQRCCG